MSPEPTTSSRERPNRSGPALFWWIVSAAVVLLLVLAAPCVLGRVYVFDDLGSFHLPLRAFYADQLARGEPFDWMPQLFCGFYVTGEGQVGAYHPLHLLLYRFLPLPAAWGCELLASYPFMLVGTYLFFLRLLRRPDAALFGSLIFTFCGFNLLHMVHLNGIAVAAHIPWLLWGIDVAFREPGTRRATFALWVVALGTGSQLLLGYPQYVWFSLVAEGAYAIFLVTGRHGTRSERIPPDCPTAPLLRIIAPWQRIAMAKTAGVMLGAMQLIPTFEALRGSTRYSPDVAFFNFGSMHPWNLIQLIAPYLFVDRVVGQNTHELGFYMGAVPLMLIVWLAVRRRRLGRFRRPVVAVFGFALVALILAIGQFGPLYQFQRFLPIIGGFRCPCRYRLLVSLSVAFLAAVAFGVMAREQRSGRRMSWSRLRFLGIPVGLSMAAVPAGLAWAGHANMASPWNVLAGPLLIGSAALLVALAARGFRPALVGLVLLAAADLGYYGMSYAAHPHAMRFDAYVASRLRTPPGDPRHRIWADYPGGSEDLQTGDEICFSGWQRADGYAGMEPARRLDYTQLAALRVAGVRWVQPTSIARTIEGLVARDAHWLEAPAPLPRVRLVTSAWPTADPARDITRIPLESTALVETPLALRPATPGTVVTTLDRPGNIHIDVTCPTKQLLVIAESYHPGWRAEVDGRSLPVLRANGDFLGCVIEPGNHEVVLRFQPWSLCFGRIVCCLGVVLTLGLGVGAKKKPRANAELAEQGRAAPAENEWKRRRSENDQGTEAGMELLVAAEGIPP